MSTLLILYTGGTLGMVPSDKGLVPGHHLDERLRTQLARLPQPRQEALPRWQLISTETPIDSSSATPVDWLNLTLQIQRYVQDGNVSGIVILHGTDTMAWCSAMLSVWLGFTLPCPVVITGAQLPLEAENGDACANIELAMRYAVHPKNRGVTLAFSGQLLRGDSARKWYTEDHKGFETPNALPLAHWPANRRDTVALPSPQPFALLPAQRRVMTALGIAAPPLPIPKRLPRVARIVLWPGIIAAQVKTQLDQVDAALLEVWGSGNLPEDITLHEVLAKATIDGKQLMAISQCPYGSTHIGVYAAGQALQASKIVEGETLTPELATALLLASGTH